jgi:hypothetical protein
VYKIEPKLGYLKAAMAGSTCNLAGPFISLARQFRKSGCGQIRRLVPSVVQQDGPQTTYAAQTATKQQRLFNIE